MCGRYVIGSKVERIKKAFEHPMLKGEVEPNYFVLPGEEVPVISSDNPYLIQHMRFGFTPSWGAKKHFAINARAEGDKNKENNPNYTGGFGIQMKPFYKSSIRQKRCLIIADAFIEGPAKEKLRKPWLIYPRDHKRPFAMAGVWDEWLNPELGEKQRSFAIITLPANKLMKDIGHHRSPVIMPNNLHRKWLNPETSLASALKMLNPFNHYKWNAFRIDPEQMKSKTVEGLAALSDTIYQEYDLREREYTEEEIDKGLHLGSIQRRRAGFKD